MNKIMNVREAAEQLAARFYLVESPRHPEKFPSFARSFVDFVDRHGKEALPFFCDSAQRKGADPQQLAALGLQ